MTAELRASVATAARRLAAEGLVVGAAGNVSAREGELVAATPTSVALADCTADDITVVDLDGRVVEGRLAPTSELSLHLTVYAHTTSTAVVHTHAPFSTAIACVLDELPVVHYQQLMLGGPVRVAPYATFGSPELADGVHAALTDRLAALMANHGSVTLGSSTDQAVEHALLLEWLCTLYHRASTLGEPRQLTQDQQTEVVLAALTRGYGRPVELDQSGRTDESRRAER